MVSAVLAKLLTIRRNKIARFFDVLVSILIVVELMAFTPTEISSHNSLVTLW